MPQGIGLVDADMQCDVRHPGVGPSHRGFRRPGERIRCVTQGWLVRRARFERAARGVRIPCSDRTELTAVGGDGAIRTLTGRSPTGVQDRGRHQSAGVSKGSGRSGTRTPAARARCTPLPTVLLDQPVTFQDAEEGGVEPPRLSLVPLRTGCRHHIGWLLHGLAGRIEPASSSTRTRRAYQAAPQPDEVGMG